jgi:5-methylthioadenosine/S-adenosylhomocysteine deaminase
MSGLHLDHCDWLVRSARDHVRDGAVYVEGNRIVAAGPRAEIAPLVPAGARVIDCAGSIVTPGLVNPHNHVYEILCRGLGKDRTTERWLRDLVYPVNAALDDEDFRHGALLAAADAFRTGTTAMVEQLTNLARFHADAELAALREAGLRARVARASSTSSTIDARENGRPDDEVAATAAFLRRWEGGELVRPWVGPSGLFSCDPDTLLRLKRLADEHGARFAIHLSETREQLDLAHARGYAGQIEWAYRIGLLDENTVVAHAIWISDAEIAILRDTGAHVVHNPTSNMLMSSGIANVPGMLAAGVNVAIGSDGPASNDAQDMLAEMKQAILLQRASTLDPAILGAAQSWRMGTEAGAAILGHAGELGRIAPGALADLAAFRVAGNPCMHPIFDPVESLVYHGSGRDAWLTIVDGAIVYRDGQYPTIDVEATLSHVERTVVPRVRAAARHLTPTPPRRS